MHVEKNLFQCDTCWKESCKIWYMWYRNLYKCDACGKESFQMWCMWNRNLYKCDTRGKGIFSNVMHIEKESFQMSCMWHKNLFKCDTRGKGIFSFVMHVEQEYLQMWYMWKRVFSNTPHVEKNLFKCDACGKRMTDEVQLSCQCGASSLPNLTVARYPTSPTCIAYTSFPLFLGEFCLLLFILHLLDIQPLPRA